MNGRCHERSEPERQSALRRGPEGFAAISPVAAARQALREGGHTVSEKGRRLKLMYATQTGTEPPVFTFFCNFPDLVDDNFERYLENRIRERFDLTGTPIRLRFRKKSE